MSYRHKRKSLFPLIIIFVFLFIANGCAQRKNTIVHPTATQSATPLVNTTPTAYLQDIAGLVYKIDNKLWMVGEDGNSHLLFNLPKDAYTLDVQFEENNVKIVYEHQDDIWISDVNTQEQRNLTNTSDRIERFPQFWTERSGVVLFASELRKENSFDSFSGAPTTINTNGENYQVLDENGGEKFLFSPDGRRVAYHLPQKLIAIYDWETSQTEFIDTNLYELPPGRQEGIWIQSWSPDERYLAGWIKGYLSYGEKYQFGIGIIDLKSKTSRLLHVYSPFAGGDIPPGIVWSLDGQWMAFSMRSEPDFPGEIISLWVARADGTEDVRIGKGINPIWSPNGSQLAYDRKVKALVDGIWIYDLETRLQYKTFLPNEAKLIDWISLIP